ncbi:MAG: hypothetical protein IPG76_04015 [Acidobacteria bacterium]|nr:hypothetical protein [Acidobacteriota bacterium]
MSVESAKSRESVLTRTLWLYGLSSLLNMLSFLVGYYLRPEGVMRGTPQSASLRATPNR